LLFLITLQIDEVAPQHAAFHLGYMKEHNENDERKTVSIQEPEIAREKNENDGGFQYKKDERYG